MVRQSGNFTQANLAQVLNSMSNLVRSSFKRGGLRRSDASRGGPGQINSIGTMEMKKGFANNSKNSDSE
ncbi:hypothetical protein QL285_033123 [Trifolium repens]|nr:hypothetical protein QL285_033123 [Trifolium repens]